MDTKDTIQSVAAILADFLKSGAKSPNHIEEIKTKILDSVLPLVVSSDEATVAYKNTCKEFLDKVIHVRGMPTRAILGDGENRSDIVSSSGSHIAQKLDILLPTIMKRYNWCIENYERQSKLYLDEQLSQFHDLLSSFLKQVPIGGTKDKSTKSKIAEIKRELRHLTNWDQLFYVYKARSFSAEMEYIFVLEGGTIAAIWHYSQLDERGEYRKTYNHKERDPYVSDDGPPTLRRSVFAFIDILGYRELIKESERTGEQQKLLQRLHHALSENRVWLEKRYPGLCYLTFELPRQSFILKAFTDNIVIGWPIKGDPKFELGSAFEKLAIFQFTMALEGFFIRGALSVGDAYIDEIAVLGEALIEAHKGESEDARDPRIILTDSSKGVVKENLKDFGHPRVAPEARKLLCDSDGQWFIDYLESILMAKNDIDALHDEFMIHKTSVEDKLKKYGNNPKVFSKYAWVASYHNFFCDCHRSYFSDEYKINEASFRAPPKQIFDD